MVLFPTQEINIAGIESGWHKNVQVEMVMEYFWGIPIQS
jgi:hypothetical protein